MRGGEVELFEPGTPAWAVLRPGDDAERKVVNELYRSGGKGAFEKGVDRMLEGVWWDVDVCIEDPNDVVFGSCVRSDEVINLWIRTHILFSYPHSQNAASSSERGYR